MEHSALCIEHCALMAINIVFDYPGHQTPHNLVRMVAWLVGTLLVVVGLLASVVAIPSGVVTLGNLVGKWQHEQMFSPDFPLRQVEIAFAVSTTVALVGLRYGRRSVRGRRGVVLFLRRFGYQGSMQGGHVCRREHDWIRLAS